MSSSTLIAKVHRLGPQLNHQAFRFLMVMAEKPYGSSYMADVDGINSKCRFDWRDLEDLRQNLTCNRLLTSEGISVSISDTICIVNLAGEEE
jgi:hypothetical protein